LKQGHAAAAPAIPGLEKRKAIQNYGRVLEQPLLIVNYSLLIIHFNRVRQSTQGIAATRQSLATRNQITLAQEIDTPCRWLSFP
jgi:hypothetical protein